MRAWLAIVFAFGLAFLASGTAGALSLPELAERTKPSVVLLTVSDASGRKLGSGTGFFISSSGQLVTNFHVVESGAAVSATDSNGRELKILGVLAWDRDRDLAILQAEPGEYPALTLGDSKRVRAGDEVVVIGSPLGLSTTISTGIVSAVRETRGVLPSAGDRGQRPSDDAFPQAWGIQITAAISPGSSGSPILTPAGEVIAVAVGSRSDGQSLNFGIPSSALAELRDTISEGSLPLPLSALESTKEANSEVLRNLAISAGALLSVVVIWLLVARIQAALERRKRRRRVAN